MTKAEELLEHARGKAIIADTGYDSDEFIRVVRSRRMKAVIHPHPSRKAKPRLARSLYKYRYRVEVFFHNLKRFRCVATRYEKTAQNFLALLHVVSIIIWIKD